LPDHRRSIEVIIDAPHGAESWRLPPKMPTVLDELKIPAVENYTAMQMHGQPEIAAGENYSIFVATR
jgi:hypothetical protein